MSTNDTVTLYRPVGPEELALIRLSGFRAFPPRLPEQPIFYAVLTEAYAVKIARDWSAGVRRRLCHAVRGAVVVSGTLSGPGGRRRRASRVLDPGGSAAGLQRRDRRRN
jgi:hypothetical protein